MYSNLIITVHLLYMMMCEGLHCFASLFYGPPWYNWMCWAEAMERDERRGEHESKNNIWCDGSHNCSLFVHGWDWKKQKDKHKHKKIWWPNW